MELVSTNPTKPTCSNVSNKRLFIFFFVCFCLLQVCMMVCRTTKRERERKTKENGEKWKSEERRERRRKEGGIETERKIKVWFRQRESWLQVFTVEFVSCVIVTIESFCVCHRFESLDCFFFCFYTQFVPYRVWKQRSTTVTWSYKHVRRNEKCRLA